MARRLTNITFIEKANIIHNNEYDYSLVQYANNYTKVKITCKKHGVFEQTPHNHLNGQGCPKCGKIKNHLSIILTNIEFIEKTKVIHGDKYDYSLVEYVDSKTNIKIICPIHGIFEQTPNDHLSNKGCSKCAGNYMDNKYFKEKSNKIHNNKYNYSLVEYKDNKTKIKIICPIHGIFEQRANNHLCGIGCSKCKQSKGEIHVMNFLKENNINFEYQKKFNNCKYKSYLFFDFYLPKYGTCIEQYKSH
jgi:hypothetical protein